MSRSRALGMTLIELMVGITIVALLLTLAIPEFRTTMQNRQIRTAAEAIQDGLQVARTEALRRNRLVEFQLRSGNSWTVGCYSPDATIDNGEQVCPATIQSRSAQDSTANAQVATQQLSGGSVVGSPVFTNALTFTPLGRVANDTSVTGYMPAGNVAQFVVTNPGAGTCAAAGGEMRCLNISVTSNGQVRMCDPAVAAGDLRAC